MHIVAVVALVTASIAERPLFTAYYRCCLINILGRSWWNQNVRLERPLMKISPG
jgi:hypothetical protein